MANFFAETYHPRWVGDWEGIAGPNGQTFMIWRNPDPEVQRISPYALPKGYMRDHMIEMCVEERVKAGSR